MVHEQELVQPQALHAGDKGLDERWPVPYAIMFIVGVSVALWSLIIALSSWLAG